MSTIRTCIVSEKAGEARLKPEDECSFSDEVLTHFIERDLTLDLLERAHHVFLERKIGVTPLTVEIELLLRAHGRLGGEV